MLQLITVINKKNNMYMHPLYKHTVIKSETFHVKSELRIFLLNEDQRLQNL